MVDMGCCGCHCGRGLTKARGDARDHGAELAGVDLQDRFLEPEAAELGGDLQIPKHKARN